jgi:transposase-like protein
MALLRYRRHRFPPAIIQRAIWLYLRFTLSYRDFEELLAERGLDISYETGLVASSRLAEGAHIGNLAASASPS